MSEPIMDPLAGVTAELERIASLDLSERAAAAESLEAGLRAALDALATK